MDVANGSPGMLPDDTPAPGTLASTAVLSGAEVAAILEHCQRRELRIVGSFRECKRLSRDQLKEIYQQSVLAILARHYRDEEHYRDELHVCRSLRVAIKRRALNFHRDQGSRGRILTINAPALHAREVARSERESPEQVVLARQDRLVIAEFLAGLTPGEREVFWLFSEGMGYNRIAQRLAMPVNEARNLVASCERKRKVFVGLHEGDRLCGYRAATITALLDGGVVSDELALPAAVHLQACARCRAEYKPSAQQLRALHKQAAALLPPVLLGPLGWHTRLAAHAQLLAGRIRPEWLSIQPGGARERATALLAGGGASIKLAAGFVTAALIAGGTITATHALEHHPPHHHRPVVVTRLTRAAQPVEKTPPALPTALDEAAPNMPTSRPGRRRHIAGHTLAIAHSQARASDASQREPGGFAYLGIPASKPAAPAPAQTAHTGGPFGP
jgi:DNA-directed RNA polymerase specialized sigma24 family protein/predicted anti-sigma-YlaC factor YlaD